MTAFLIAWFGFSCVIIVGALVRIRRLTALLRDVVIAADRMSAGWAGGDDMYRNGLWRKLHTAARSAEEEVYPL